MPKGELRGHHWEVLRSLLPLYQAITTVTLGNGKSTSFWNDVWFGDDAIADRFPALYSYCTQKDVSVSYAVNSNLQNAFVNKLTTQAAVELGQVQLIIQQTTLDVDSENTRQSPFSCGHGKLDTSAIYKLLKARGRLSDWASEFI